MIAGMVMALNAPRANPIQRAINILKSAGPGAWYDPSDLTTLFQDSAGTTPVTAVEQPVGLVLDKSKGLVLGSELVTNGDFSSATGWSPGTGWSISGGVATKVAGTASDLYTAAFPSGSLGKYVSITLTVTVTAGSLMVIPGGYQALAAITSSGTHTYKTCVTHPTSNPYLYLTADAAFAGTIDNISVREIPGNHLIQPTATSRPTLSSRYNLLTKTEQFDDAYWTGIVGGGGSVPVRVANDAVAPDGTTTADKLTFGAATTADLSLLNGVVSSLVTGGSYVVKAFVKAATPGDVGKSIVYRSVGGSSYSALTLTTDYQQISLTSVAAGPSTDGLSIGLRPVEGGSTGTVSVHIWGASLTTAADASLPYQRVNTATDYDYDFSKFPAYLKFDGVDDSLYSAASVDFNGAPADGQTKRNLLSASEAFDDAIWVKLNVTATAGKVSETAVTGVFIAYQSVMPGAGTYTFAVEAKAAERSRIALEYASSTPFAVFDLSTGVVQSFGSSTATITSLGGGWYRCTMTATLAAGSTSAVGVRDNAGNRSYAGSAGSGVLVRGAQLEVGSSATAYQKTGTDKMTVFAGVHKASDAAAGILVESSSAPNSTAGTFTTQAPVGSGMASFGIWNAGTIQSGNHVSGATYAAPSTRVLTGVGDISGDLVVLRLNGAQVASAATDQGTGNYGNYPLYIGSRNNASFPFSGRIYQLAIKGKALSAGEIATVESFINSRTKAFV
jgi:hypothetical protein